LKDRGSAHLQSAITVVTDQGYPIVLKGQAGLHPTGLIPKLHLQDASNEAHGSDVSPILIKESEHRITPGYLQAGTVLTLGVP
jgi:hypothetical protein